MITTLILHSENHTTQRDVTFAAGTMTQSEYDLHKARLLADAGRSQGYRVWHTVGIVALTFLGVWLLGLVFTAFGT
jgi:hypothetical protein